MSSKREFVACCCLGRGLEKKLHKVRLKGNGFTLVHLRKWPQVASLLAQLLLLLLQPDNIQRSYCDKEIAAKFAGPLEAKTFESLSSGGFRGANERLPESGIGEKSLDEEERKRPRFDFQQETLVVASRWQNEVFLPCKLVNLDEEQTVSLCLRLLLFAPKWIGFGSRPSKPLGLIDRRPVVSLRWPEAVRVELF